MTSTRSRRGRRAILLLAAGLALAAALASTAVPGGRAEGAATAGAAKTVQIRNFAFMPATVRVQRGARVAFANSSKVAHTATRAGSFDTKRIAPGSSVAVGFKHRGTFAYHCKIHPFMKGKVVVE